MSPKNKELASFSITVIVDPSEMHQLRQDMLDAVNKMRGYPDGLVPMFSQEEIEARSPGHLEAHRQVMNGSCARYPATAHVDIDGRVTLTL